MITIVFTTHAGFTDTLFHIADWTGTSDDAFAFAIGAWYAFVNTRDGRNVQSFDVTVDTDGDRVSMHIGRDMSGCPSVM